MKTLKFLHLADLHLDRPLNGGRLKLPYEKAQKRAREAREALVQTVDLAHREEVGIILIAGDLWEEDSLAPDSVQFVMETLGRAGMPVVIAPGNHDYYSPSSHYSDEIVNARYGRRWPENVHIFRDYDFSHFLPPGLDGLQVVGLAYRSNQAVSVRKLSESMILPDAELRICLVHGSRDDNLPPGKLRTLPFSDAELLGQPFDYVALGHYHSRSAITDAKGKIRAAYPGSTIATAADETGPHGVLIGELNSGGIAPEALTFHPLDPRQIYRLTLDVTGLKHTMAVESMIMKRLIEAQTGNDDMALVELTGRFPLGSRIPFSEDFVRQARWHLKIDASKVQPEWEIEGETPSEPRTTEEFFRARLNQQIQEALGRGDDAEAIRLQNALYYGLDALHGAAINPRTG